MSIQLLTCREAAAFLRLRPQTLARWRTEGRGPAFVRIGGRVFYERAELERFVLAGRRRSTCDRPREPSPEGVGRGPADGGSRP